VTLGEVGRSGSPTFDDWVVRKDYAEAHPDVVKAFATTTLLAYEDYRHDPRGWLAKSEHLDAVARIAGGRKSDMPGLVGGNEFPTLAQQRSALGAPTVNKFASTAQFLKVQGKIEVAQLDRRFHQACERLHYARR